MQCLRFLVSLTALPLALIQAPASAGAGVEKTLSGPGMLSDTTCTTSGKAVDEKGFMPIGGIEQWVRVKGASCTNPIIVVIHGGPGNPNIPFADNLYKAWEKDFTIVQWDQRGAGMTCRAPGTIRTS